MDNQLPPEKDNYVVVGVPNTNSVQAAKTALHLGPITIPLNPGSVVALFFGIVVIFSSVSYGFYSKYVSDRANPAASADSNVSTKANTNASSVTLAKPKVTSPAASPVTTTTPSTTPAVVPATTKKVPTSSSKTTSKSSSSGSSSSSSSANSSTQSSGSSSSGSNNNQGSSSPPAPTPVEPDGPSGSWNLIFDDEFTSDSSLNTTTWSPDWFGNGNTQNQTVMYSSNVSIGGGYLNLEASGAEGASGSIISTNPDDYVAGHTGFQFTYGFAEAKVYFPASGSEIANWPAFWLDGQDWPMDGEIDVVEGLSGSACYHFHYGTSTDYEAQGNCVSGNYSGWHTFGVNWQPNSITYYYDGVQVGQITSDITSSPMYLMLENSTGPYGLLPVTTPSDVQVSYVRVWQ